MIVLATSSTGKAIVGASNRNISTRKHLEFSRALSFVLFSGENVKDNSGISEKSKSGDTLIIKMQGTTQSLSIEYCFQDHLLNDSFMSTENIDDGLDAVDKTIESLETDKLKLAQYDETSIKVSTNDSSTVKQALTYRPLSRDVNGNGISRIFQENKRTDTVDGGDRKTWTGEGQSIEAQVVKIASQGQEFDPGPAIENACADTEPAFRNEHDPLQVEKNISDCSESRKQKVRTALQMYKIKVNRND
ncbi:hypothetical protein SUGI_0563120 [Cryptomeria japonica]|nr:hypothetical protein SUGI_0563120 [Cryptomeria japonica]